MRQFIGINLKSCSKRSDLFECKRDKINLKTLPITEKMNINVKHGFQVNTVLHVESDFVSILKYMI